MITETDGFKRPEKGDPMGKGIMATYENTVLLHEQVKELREQLERLMLKLEEKAKREGR